MGVQVLDVQYQAVRESIGFFDLTEKVDLIKIQGNGRIAFMNRFITRELEFMGVDQTSSGLILSEDATIIGDITVHIQDDYLLVQAWKNQSRVRGLLLSYQEEDEVEVTDVSPLFSMYCIEGPQAWKLAQTFIEYPISHLAYKQDTGIEFNQVNILCSRNGFTGEYGYQFFVPKNVANEVKDALLERGVESGIVECEEDVLAICRLEFRFPDIYKEVPKPVNPFENSLQWMVDFQSEFIGKSRLLELSTEKIEYRLVCLSFNTAVTQGASLEVDGNIVGNVTYTLYSPSLERFIGVGLVKSELAASGVQFQVRSDDRIYGTGTVVSAPFIMAKSMNVKMD